MPPIPTEQQGRLAYGVPEACHKLSLGRTSLYQLAKDGKVRFVKLAGRTLVPATELERLLSEAA
jgi:excisionase family DNA binding protein